MNNSEGIIMIVTMYKKTLLSAGKIDHAHHNNNAYKALDETLMLSKAVTKAEELTNKTDTLLVVTGDHSHSFAFSGYPYMGHDILGIRTVKNHTIVVHYSVSGLYLH